MKIALSQYPVEYLASRDAWGAKLDRLVGEAADAGAHVLVFPEYASMELTSLFAPEVQADVRLQLPELQALLPTFLDAHREVARRRGVYVLAGSFPVREGDRYVNRAHFFSPDGRTEHQDKLVMTRFEAEEWGVSASEGLKVFETEVGKIGVNICYDAEFPPLARALAEAGADLLLVPSATEAITGYHRVEIGARARALENQFYAAHAPLVGTAPWNEAIDVNTGAAGVYGPIDHGFSPAGDGVVVKGPLNLGGWVYADLDLDRLRAVRENGVTLNSRDWAHGVRGASGGVANVRF